MAHQEVEIFIDTVITNNEERSLEQLLKKYLPAIQLKQYRYCRCEDSKEFLSHISNYNPNKEIAYVGRTALDLSGICFIRFDENPNEGIFYVCKNVKAEELEKEEIKNIFANPHASTITRA
ncbi:hypothetical protein HYZ98_03020 [Candidatus Peregrinibacteria bacterium]|nr:hypothetical protein [Candidatus Peregrinibacteria bacterium]